MYEEKTKEMAEKAKTEAIINWVITSVIYLVCAESVVFLAKNKTLQMGNFDTQPTMQQPEMQRNTGNFAFENTTYSNNINYEQMNQNTMNQGTFNQSGMNQEINNQNEINSNPENNTNINSKIKWDL